VMFFPLKPEANQMERPAFRIQAGPGLPFGDGELRRMVAVRLRGLESSACSPVSVTTGPEAGLLVISCPDRRAEVWVGDRTGEDASRMVAIVLADLVTAEIAASPPSTGATAAPPVVQSAPPAAAPAPARGRWSVWAVPGAAWDTSARTAFEPHVGVGWMLSRRAGLSLDAGWSRVSASPSKLPVAAELDALPVRAGGTLALGPATLAAGAVARGFHAHAANGHFGVRPGAYVGGAWTFLPRWPLHPYVTLGLDVYADKLEVRLDEQVALTAGRLSPWAGIGAVWSSTRP
jgi:hypothetical protein